MQEAPKVEYLPCEKTGYHYGEVLNMICLQPGCQEQMLCCCACIEQHHKQHNTKPLRLVLLEASKAAQNIVPTNFNIDIALELINTQLKASIESFNKYKKDVVTKLDSIETSVISYYAYLVEQVKIKNMDPKVQLEKAFQIIQSAAPNPHEYRYSIRRVSGLVGAKKEEKSMTQTEVLIALDLATEDMKKKLKSNLEQLTGRLTNFSNVVADLTKNIQLWKQTSYKFSPVTKHPDIKILSDLVVKSTNSSGYKFAIMQPSLQGGSNIKEMAFKVKQSSSNWVAVGMCHKNIVASKNYGFNFNTLGHGAYMVSANGGCWNNTKADQNNSIKSFKFGKGDIICIRVNFSEKTIIFRRNTDKFTINFSTIAGDQLYPCALFYYLNDEIEFLPNQKF